MRKLTGIGLYSVSEPYTAATERNSLQCSSWGVASAITHCRKTRISLTMSSVSRVANDLHAVRSLSQLPFSHTSYRLAAVPVMLPYCVLRVTIALYLGIDRLYLSLFCHTASCSSMPHAQVDCLHHLKNYALNTD